MTLCKVYYIESNIFLLFDIINFEEIPTSVTFRVTVNSHNQIIFIFLDCDGQIKIPSLKFRAEFDVLVFWCWIYSFKKPIFTGSYGKTLFRLMKMVKLEAFEGFVIVKERLNDDFIFFIFCILFEKFNIWAWSKSHINNLIRKRSSKTCQGFWDGINTLMCKYEWYLLEDDFWDVLGLPSILETKNTRYKDQEAENDLFVCDYAW